MQVISAGGCNDFNRSSLVELCLTHNKLRKKWLDGRVRFVDNDSETSAEFVGQCEIMWYNRMDEFIESGREKDNMIRLIASDMDGSLLDDKKRIPPEFFDILQRLKKKGITFVVASGRSYVTLKKNFHPASGEISYICDNGAYVVQGGAAAIDTIPRRYISRIIKACDKLQGVRPILCGVRASYMKEYTHDFNNEVGSYYINRCFVDDLTTVDDDIFKIAIFDANNPENNSYPYLKERFDDILSIQISGKVWMDIVSKGINKGVALEKIQRDMGITPEETMAFGDFYNDIELLGRAHYSFVMENSNDDMRRYGNFVAASNNDNGVIKAIEQYALS
jgi:Cof subfamily protein (haloacid dehalogenase superfamily)